MVKTKINRKIKSHFSLKSNSQYAIINRHLKRFAPSFYRKKLRIGDIRNDKHSRYTELNNLNEGLLRAAAVILPSNIEISLCRCVVTENVEDDEFFSPTCHAKDTVGLIDFPCSLPVKHQTLVRPHYRIPFMSVCDNHRTRLCSHQCCPTCGIFCVKGRFKICKETETPHLFHIGCENLIGRCAHCGSDKIVEEDVNLEQSSFETVKLKACVYPFRDEQQHTSPLFQVQKIVRERTHIIEKSDFQISAFVLSDRKEREAINRAIEQANKVFSHSMINESSFVDAIKSNDLVLTILCLMKGISPNTRVGSRSEMMETKCDRKHSANHEIYQTALNYAAFKGFGLLAHVDVNITDSDGYNALMYALMQNHKHIALMLIEAETNLRVKDNNGNTALHLAAIQSDAEVIKALIVSFSSRRENVPDRGSFGFEAAIRRRAKLIDAQDNDGLTALMRATTSGNIDAVKVLLFFGAKTGMKDLEGNTALHLAILSNAAGLFTPLINVLTPCEINCQNNNGDTALMLASNANSNSMVKYLIQKKANLALINNNGYSSQDVSQMVEDDLTKLLIETRTFLKCPSNPVTLLHKRRIITEDLSNGRERHPIPVINDIDNEKIEGLCYVRSVVCSCDNDCSEKACGCKTFSLNGAGQFLYDKERRLLQGYDFSQIQTDIYECSEACSCSTISCANRIMQKGSRFRFEIRRTIDKGWGIFAVDEIPSGSFIFEYAGELLPHDLTLDLKEDSYMFNLDWNLFYGEVGLCTFVIDASRFGNVTRFMNHSCEPNVGIIRGFWDHQDFRAPHICFFSSRKIQAKEEICCDYGEKFWQIKGEMFSCLCGSKQCKYSANKIKDVITKIQSKK